MEKLSWGGGADAGRTRERWARDARLSPRGRCGRAPRASGPLDARLSPRGAPRGRAAAAPPSFPAPPPGDISSSAVRRFSLSECGPPCAGLLLHRRRSHYWCRSRFRPLGHFKTMPDYGARPGTTEHAGISGNKTAGRRLVHLVKCRAWTAGLG